MKIKSLVIFGLSILFFSHAQAGGSVVNNGAGIVEQNFHYAYLSIEKLSSECLKKDVCDLGQNEIELLTKILNVVKQNKLKANKIIYVSEKKVPGFFTTGPEESHRIAKTGLDASTPIYVNSDLLYTATGAPTLGFPIIVAILTHEIGHQTGETSHTLLDTIGAELRYLVERRMTVHSLDLSDQSPNRPAVTIINHNFPVRQPDLLISWNSLYSKSLTEIVTTNLRCNSESSYSTGYDILNGHFDFIGNAEDEIGFKALINLYCYSALTQNPIIEKRELSFRFNRAGQVRNFSVSDGWGSR